MIATRKDQPFGRRVYEPTPKDIRHACEAIKATWSPRERAKRERGLRADAWKPPMIRLSDILEVIGRERADGLR